MAAVFDPSELQVGPAVPVLQGYRYDSGRRFPQVAVSQSGTLAYVAAGHSTEPHSLEWVSSDGTLTRVGELPEGAATVDLSPDGTLAVISTDVNPPRVFLWDVVRQVPTGLQVEGATNPRWHPDGQHVAFSRGGGLVLLDVDDGSETALVTTETIVLSSSFSADGDTVVYATFGESGTQDIFALVPGDTTPQPIMATDAQEYSPALSPDGRWLAFCSDTTGKMEVYVARFPSGTGQRRITTNGGNQPLWRQDGRALFFQEFRFDDQGRQVAEHSVVTVQADDSLELGTPQSLFVAYDSAAARRSYTFSNNGAVYHATADGGQFLMVYEPRPEPATEVNIVLNWFEELKRLVPTN